ncbi:MAG: ribonuclease III [Clostridia bacterium]|nr:ribonuclease III [Clostridia bacterium]
MNVCEVEQIIGYSFTDISLLDIALTHPSYANGKGIEDYQRFEYLGDALIGFIVADELYAAYPDADEGELSKMRINIVERRSLSAVVVDMGLDKYLRATCGITVKIACDIFEAVAAAVYLDGGADKAREFILRFLGKKIRRASAGYGGDYKSAVNEKYAGKKIEFRTSSIGDVHTPRFMSELYVEGLFVSRGEGFSKRDAEQDSARAALRS